MSEYHEEVLKAEATIRELAKSLANLDEKTTLVEESRRSLQEAVKLMSQSQEGIESMEGSVLDGLGKLRDAIEAVKTRSWITLGSAILAVLLLLAHMLWPLLAA
jgi:hypothetical protein